MVWGFLLLQCEVKLVIRPTGGNIILPPFFFFSSSLFSIFVL